MNVRKKPFESNVRKGEIASNQYFLLFLQCFLPVTIQSSIFETLSLCQLQLLSVWDSLNPFVDKDLNHC